MNNCIYHTYVCISYECVQIYNVFPFQDLCVKVKKSEQRLIAQIFHIAPYPFADYCIATISIKTQLIHLSVCENVKGCCFTQNNTKKKKKTSSGSRRQSLSRLSYHNFSLPRFIDFAYYYFFSFANYKPYVKPHAGGSICIVSDFMQNLK